MDYCLIAFNPSMLLSLLMRWKMLTENDKFTALYSCCVPVAALLISIYKQVAPGTVKRRPGIWLLIERETVSIQQTWESTCNKATTYLLGFLPNTSIAVIIPCRSLWSLSRRPTFVEQLLDGRLSVFPQVTTELLGQAFELVPKPICFRDSIQKERESWDF